MQETEIQDWKSQRAEQLSIAQGKAISASTARPSSDGLWMESVPRSGRSEQATLRNLDLSEAQTGAPWTVNSRPVRFITSV